MRLELKIINFLGSSIENKFTINEISKTLKEHYSFVHRTINNLAKQLVIIKTKVGKAYLCSLNLENEKTLLLLGLSEIEEREKFYNLNKELRLILEDFINALQGNIITLVLFGSYARGTASKKSDIDLLLICKRKLNIESIIKEVYAKYGKEIMPIVLDEEGFKKQKDRILIKEIIKEHYILYGAENFINLAIRK